MGRHLHMGLVAIGDWSKPTAERTVAMATAHQCKKVIGLDWDNFGVFGGRLGSHRGKCRGRHKCRHIYIYK